MSSVPASPHLDVRNVLWLLAAMVFVVAPHMLRLPYWVAAFFLAVVAWRAWIAWAAMRSPTRPGAPGSAPSPLRSSITNHESGRCGARVAK